jgi:hypothetical protein
MMVVPQNVEKKQEEAKDPEATGEASAEGSEKE